MCVVDARMGTVMTTAWVDLGAVVFALTGFLLWYLILRAVTRPAAVAADTPTMDLGDEPPAVVSLLAGGWELADDAAESTLLDLAARGYLQIRQPGDDPRQTTLHLTGKPADDLLPFEIRVLDRVSAVAMRGVAPVTALTFPDLREAAAWHKALRVEVVVQARRLGLSRRRFSPATTSALSLGALAVATVVFGAIVHLGLTQLQPPSLTAGLCVGGFVALVVLGPLGAICARYPGERDTPAGRDAARCWLGVSAWLRGHEAFASLPPAAVAVWDRYLSYGAALGVTRVASDVLDLGTGERRRRWSCYGGVWHRVRIRYPRVWPHYGGRARELAKPALKAVVVGTLLLVFYHGPRTWLPSLLGPDAIPPHWFGVAEPLAVAAGVVLVAVGVVRLLQVLFDVRTPRNITGEVLWTEPWPRTLLGRDYPGRSYLAVDDGSANRTAAWAMPSHLSCEIGDVVRVTVRRWTRRVIDLSVVQRGRTIAGTAALDFRDLDHPGRA